MEQPGSVSNPENRNVKFVTTCNGGIMNTAQGNKEYDDAPGDSPADRRPPDDDKRRIVEGIRLTSQRQTRAHNRATNSEAEKC